MTWTLSAFADEAGPSCDEQIAALKRAGMRFIDLRNVEGQNITVLPTQLAAEVRRKLDDADIRVAMYGSPIGKIDVVDDLEIDLEKLRHLADMRDVFGCRAVRIFSYYNAKKGLDHAGWRDATIERLGRLIELAEQLDLVLYHENESDIFGDRSDDVVEVAELRGDRLKLIYDFANYIRTGESGWQSWQKLRHLTDCFHFKDQKRNNEHMPMGQGETNAQRILRDAAQAGWSGPCTLEPHLTHSRAVLATHATGSGAQALADLSPAETFHIAATTAQELLRQVGVEAT